MVSVATTTGSIQPWKVMSLAPAALKAERSVLVWSTRLPTLASAKLKSRSKSKVHQFHCGFSKAHRRQ